MSPPDTIALRHYLGEGRKDRTISDARHSVSLADMIERSCLAGRCSELSGRSVLIATSRQLFSALAMIELDGVARRLLLCPPDFGWERLQVLVEQAGIDTIITDQPISGHCAAGRCTVIGIDLPERRIAERTTDHATEWLMLTSGTSGLPKIVRHTLDGLAGAIIAEGPTRHSDATWATFYDIRRYGGLQILLRAVIGGGSMVLSEPGETIAAHVARLQAGGVTHISGTPSHWRKLLMSGAAADFSPRYIRLSGEIADQAVLDGLAQAFPHASIGHAYASTEAGVGFSVDDGREGFPAHLIGRNRDGVEMKVVEGSLRIRSKRTARAYVGADAPPLADAEGFVDTGDIVELRGERYHFVGRRGGIINIGGLKVHPEEVEAVINRHACVQMSRARSRRSPITGAIVVADVILTGGIDEKRHETIRSEILSQCKDSLAAWKVPAVIRFVERLEVTAAGKLARTDA
ncbi:class I adenylate-forming enzyme family protein [Bradyrhizobium iriomotense]|uniref:class I adenylate-forming enzyme family protein n=1 Tax=Bradyrhizobium iriomotense TaxID=441950 RepID=UPI001B8A1C24|nr:fatty acid--CoA ligase family protein [Bradyrhizobium iriomotense]MBR0784899.1 long-chain fatty acid--CoA ligase [Bradyrhizobium iriomotense]